MTYAPGTHAATLLFDLGLSFDAVVRSLVVEIGMSADEATLATEVAASESAPAPLMRVEEVAALVLGLVGGDVIEPEPGAVSRLTDELTRV
jgi:hypothetical protein